ncbi:methyl-accepting chemotaxis protein [Jannaschia seohaensis]|uniref:Methyl-accepting chemotaxis protein (MCP) signaling protein n=1 Tax=Jannaschia seohaensis TaxID=475081 RepID=A0A2Y9C3R2_9RHOB|nr:methyl-accepting chemotaxis protein [Jannaschia seohaensis]PWJ21985.1 methyl-accepting chemotaxis protein (MCP) signaling protein [Jannaschia seohaensis]SSA38263.1 Methyl-accepting chemotaxis protein (MCP) signalling domain-containing protein [Jannaschia seohaensis]
MTAQPRILASHSPPEEIDLDVVGRVVELLTQCRMLSLTSALLAVQWASARGARERAAFASAFHADRRAYIDAISEKMRIAPFMARLPEIARPRAAVHGFLDTLQQLETDGTEMDHASAAKLAERARLHVHPALREIILYLEGKIREGQERERAGVAARADLVDRTLHDMGRIGRMIGSISINASVEAARAGGESGRAFQVIAAEVRDLARQSATLLEEMKQRLAERLR